LTACSGQKGRIIHSSISLHTKNGELIINKKFIYFLFVKREKASVVRIAHRGSNTTTFGGVLFIATIIKI